MCLHNLPILPPHGGRMGRLCRYIEVATINLLLRDVLQTLVRQTDFFYFTKIMNNEVC